MSLQHKIGMCISPTRVSLVPFYLVYPLYGQNPLNGAEQYCNSFIPWTHSSREMWNTLVAPSFQEIMSGRACDQLESGRILYPSDVNIQLLTKSLKSAWINDTQIL